ncbi:serine/threonine protein kinase, partial [Phycomyces blakesleeanus NRRL 1555(-)]
GGFARVYQVQGEDERWFAAKVITKAALRQSKNKEKLLAEINIHRSMNHNSIIRFDSCFEDQTNVYLIVELCHNKATELMKARGRLTEPEVRYILIQILEACRYMHENRVIHRDIKLGNILLDKNLDVKVGDFGLSALLLSTEDRKRTICGTPNYIAPEILFGKEGHDYKVDIWSIGVLTYTLLVGRHPFHQSELRDIYKKIRNNSHEASYGFPSEHPISDAAKDLIARLLVNDPKERLSVPEVLQHPFF